MCSPRLWAEYDISYLWSQKIDNSPVDFANEFADFDVQFLVEIYGSRYSANGRSTANR